MHILWIIIILSIIFLPAISWSAIHYSASVSLSDINAAISKASSGDTVIVPAGNVVWNNNLVISKGIKLIGAGKGKTVITSNYNSVNSDTFDSRNFLVVYAPNPTYNETFRLSGFSFSFAKKCSGIQLRNTSSTIINKIRVDNNDISDSSGRALQIYGTVYGVIDHNTFSNNSKHIDSYGVNATSWNNLTFEYGSANNIFYEDNTFTITSTPHSAGAGGRYVARFNTYKNINASAGLYPWYDMHGNQGPGMNHATMGAEVYGNTLFMQYNKGVRFFDHRGGRVIVFDNNAVTSGSIDAQVREEYDDSLNPTTNPQPQHPSDGYYWNNVRNGSYLLTTISTTDCCNAIEENFEWFRQKAGFDGTSGVGVGLYANIPSSCSKGVGYWATDKGGDWNTANEKADDGALYRCGTNNDWKLYYVPHKYPHPFTFLEESVSPPEIITTPKGFIAIP